MGSSKGSRPSAGAGGAERKPDENGFRWFDHNTIKKRSQLNARSREIFDEIDKKYPLRYEAEPTRRKKNPERDKEARRQLAEWEKETDPIQREYEYIVENWAEFKTGKLRYKELWSYKWRLVKCNKISL